MAAKKSAQNVHDKNLSLHLNVAFAIAFLILLILGIFLVRDKLLYNASEMGTYLAESYAMEEQNRMVFYEMFLKLGAGNLNESMRNNATSEELQQELSHYSRQLTELLGSEIIDPYAVINGTIIAASTWEGDATFDYQSSTWYQQALDSDNGIIFTDAYTDTITGELLITMATKLNGQDNVLAFDILLRNYHTHQNKSSFPAGSSYFLFDNSNKLIYLTGGLDIEDPDTQTYAQTLLEGVKKGSFSSHSSTIRDLSGQNRAVYYFFMNNGWVSIITIPVHQILQGNLNMFMVVLGIICGILWIAMVIVLFREHFGQKEIKHIRDTLRILGDTYYAIYRINFETETYESIKSSDDVRERLGKTGNYAHMLDIVGETVEENTYEEFKKNFSLNNIRKLVNNQIYEFGGDYQRRFGQIYKWVSIKIIFNQSLGLNEVIMCFREIDLEKQKQLQQHQILENALETSKKMSKKKNLFFSNVSHDMRTPLNAIIGLSELALQNQTDSAKTEEYLRKIELSGKQLLTLINDILDMSRIEQGEGSSLDYQPMNIQECVENCVSIFQETAVLEKKHLELSTDIQSPIVLCDSFRMNQILNNLLSNAFKYSNEGALIQVELRQLDQQKDRGKYQLIVRDTGIGMSEKFLSQIFEPFARETMFAPSKAVGTGLGMPIVKSLVQQMSGEITVQSELGKGSIFTISLPLQIAQVTVSEDPSPELPVSYTLEGKTILLAEDNELNMEIATEFLSMMGADILPAWNGREAVERFQEQEPWTVDAVLMDMQMPEMDGCTACRKIRQLNRPDAKAVPIIAVTANAFAEDIARTTEAGMNAHIAKPIDFQLLCEILEKYSVSRGQQESPVPSRKPE